MKRNLRLIFSCTIVVLFSIFIITGCKKAKKESFTAAFLTDIHLHESNGAVQGLSLALDSVNALKPDFIITGGDLIMDALGQTYGRADSLYKMYQETIKKAGCKVYSTMGNHEIYGIYSKSGADPANPEFGEKMFEKRLGNSYQAFEHKGWKFIIINSIEDTGKDRYIGKIDSLQVEWLKSELAGTDKSMPIAISTHIPFITANTQKYEGSTVASDSSTVVYNSKEVLDLFRGYNLKLVLQGHLHTVEDICIDGIHFITGGAVSSGWWRGLNRDFEEGFVHLTFYPDDFSWRYVDYGWEAVK